MSLIDIATLGMLGFFSGYSILLNRRVRRLQKALIAIGPAFEQFSTAVDDLAEVHANAASAQAVTPKAPVPAVKKSAEEPLSSHFYRLVAGG